MDSEDDASRSRPRPLLLVGAALALAAAIVFGLNMKMPGRTYTVMQYGKVRAFGHSGAIRYGGNCVDCHR